MRFMVIMYPGPDGESGKMPSTELLAAMGKFNEEMVNAGILLAGEGLQPSSKGARLKFQGNGNKPVVSDGPFTEAKEIIGGFWIIKAKDKAEAIQWMSRCPTLPGQMIEIRQVAEAEDFAAADPTGELRAKEEELRKRSEQRK